MDIDSLNKPIEKKGYRLEFEHNALQLISLEQKFSPLCIDFSTGKSRHRRLFGGGVNQPLAKAVGLKRLHKPDVLDLTAGLGRDAFVLASMGCQVTLLERSEVIWALLANALERACQDEDIIDIVKNMSLVNTDSLLYLANMQAENAPAVIYLDPMYPHRDKSALVKKEMRIFRDLVGDDQDSNLLLNQARQHALKRIVVKRPKGAGFLDGEKPHSQVNSKNTRYDIYMPLHH